MSELRVWVPPACGAGLAARARRLPYPLGEPGVRFYAQARQALRRCLPALGLVPEDEVLVPEYHHGSEIEAVLKAGLVPRTYDCGADLQPQQASLERLLGPRTRALHLVHYLGFPQDAARWRRWCDDRGILLVEDAAQSWLAERDGLPVGSHGDLSVFCLYKTMGLPDGAAVVGRVPLPPPERRGVIGTRALIGPAARAVLLRVRSGLPAHEYDHAADVDVPCTSRRPAVATRWLLPRAVGTDIAAARRGAYRTLLLQLDHLVAPAFRDVPAGASPFAFPLAVADKAQTLRVLLGAGVDGLDLWRQPHPATTHQPGGTAALMRQHVVCLPVHQDLTAADLQRLADASRGLEPAAGLRRQRAG